MQQLINCISYRPCIALLVLAQTVSSDFIPLNLMTTFNKYCIHFEIKEW